MEAWKGSDLGKRREKIKEIERMRKKKIRELKKEKMALFSKKVIEM